MAIAASIYLVPPNILLSDCNSGWNIVPQKNNGQFGLVEQINSQTSIVSIGSVIFYNPIDSTAITLNSNAYRTINENKVIFVEVGGGGS